MVNSKEYGATEDLYIMQCAKNYNGFLINDILSYRTSDKKLLDFGSGVGTYTHILKDRGLEVSCIEIDPPMREKLIADGLQTYADITELPDNSIDYIYSLNVLEHIENDGEILKVIYQKMSRDGIFYLYVPAFNSIYTQHDKRLGHYRRYTKKSLIPLAEAAGFKIAKSYYVDSLGFFATLLFKFIGNPQGDISTKSITIYDKWIFPLSKVLDIFFKPFFGKNLTLILKK